MTKAITIIAEAGVNHNASLDTALRLVDVAADAGADFVKFQTAIPELVVTGFAEKADYQKASSGSTESQLEMTRRLHLPLQDFVSISNYCTEKGLPFLSTAFDEVSIDFLGKLGQKIWKIPSGEITNLPYIRAVAARASKVIMSTGMCSLDDIEAALVAFEDGGIARNEITVLHCSTEYPAAFVDANLRAMLTIRDYFGVEVGYSDHTLGIEAAIAAAALGASVIEKHFTLDRSSVGPDHKASLEPGELRDMVAAIRNIELALGDGIKRPMASEVKNIPVVRRSLVARSVIKVGEVFTPQNVISKRPGTGISPMRWDEVMGRRARREFAIDELIEL